MAAKTYIVFNSGQVVGSAPTKQPTGTAIRTMMQLAPATGYAIRIIEWGCSFDGSSAATPGIVELFDAGPTNAATMSQAYGTGDIQPYSDPNAVANTSGSSGVPLNLSTGTSGYATAAVTEGTVSASRMFDTQLIAPTNQYVKQFPLGREPELKGGNFLRLRVTFGTTVNMLAYIIFEV